MWRSLVYIAQAAVAYISIIFIVHARGGVTSEVPPGEHDERVRDVLNERGSEILL